jgi:hypothetical protein
VLLAGDDLQRHLAVAGFARAASRSLITGSVAVIVVARIRSAVTYGRSAGLTNIRWPRWFSRYCAPCGVKCRAVSTYAATVSASAGGIACSVGIPISAASAARCSSIAARGPAWATARAESAGSPSSKTAPPVNITDCSAALSRPESAHRASISRNPAMPPPTSPAVLIQPVPSLAVKPRACLPVAAM